MADARARRPEWPPKPAPAPATAGAADDDEAAAASNASKDDGDELGRLFESRLQVNEDEDDGHEDDDEDDDEQQQQEALARALAALAPPSSASPQQKPPPPTRLLPSLDLAGVAAYLSSDACRRVVFMVGAGASTSAGIPDFRTRGTGLYDNLADLGLPHPEAVFDLDYFRENPRPFFTLARSLYPRSSSKRRRRRRGGVGGGGVRGKEEPRAGQREEDEEDGKAEEDAGGEKGDEERGSSGPRPTPAHHFFELVRRKGKLSRVFSQNIDALEHAAGLGEREVVAAHGNFFSCHCIECGRSHPRELVERAIFFDEESEEDEVDEEGSEGSEAREKTNKPPPPREFAPPRCPVDEGGCGGLVKPSIVFFGEGLPARFFERRRRDLPQADLLIVVGTSLVVHPFAGLLHDVEPHVPRLLINRERVGEAAPARGGRGGGALRPGFVFDAAAPGGGRDVLFLGDADDGVRELARLCGWGEELEALVGGGGRGGAGGDGEGAEEAAATG